MNEYRIFVNVLYSIIASYMNSQIPAWNKNNNYMAITSCLPYKSVAMVARYLAMQ